MYIPLSSISSLLQEKTCNTVAKWLSVNVCVCVCVCVCVVYLIFPLCGGSRELRKREVSVVNGGSVCGAVSNICRQITFNNFTQLS